MDTQFRRVRNNFVKDVSGSKFDNRFYNDILSAGGICFGFDILGFVFNHRFQSSKHIACSKSQFPFVMNALLKNMKLLKLFDNDKCHGCVTNVYKWFSYFSYNEQIRICVLNSDTQELIERLQDFTEFDKFASRIFHDNGKIMLSVPADEHLNPMSLYIRFNETITLKELTNSFSMNIRDFFFYNTYHPFIVDKQELDKFFAQFDCGICLQPITFDTFHVSICSHTFHHECMSKWTSFARGEEIIAARNQCPCCKQWLNWSYSRLDFENFSYAKCFVCGILYSVAKTEISCVQQNHEQEDGQRQRICDDCSNVPLANKILICPGCGLELQHAGGCNQFACCKYGIEQCRTGCDHGSTDFVKFCGHHWIIE